MTIKKNDWIIFRNYKGKEWLRRIIPGKSLHTHRGYINFDDIIGQPYGSIIKILNDQVVLLEPKIAQLSRNMTHKTNIIYEGDAVAMLSGAGVGPGDKVLEVGTGSGGFTLYLSYYITRNNDQGLITSIDLKEEHSQVAKENLEKFNLFKEKQIELKTGNIEKLLSVQEFYDAAFIDMPNPWLVMEKVKECCQMGKSIMIFLPNWYQVEQTISRAKELHLTVYDVFESNRRPMDVNPDRHIMRPKFRSIVYSGIIIHLIKTELRKEKMN